MADYSDSSSLSYSSDEASEYHASDEEEEEEEEEEDDGDDDDDDDEEDDEDNDGDETLIISSSSDDASELSDAEAYHESSEVTPAQEAHCNRVTHLLQGRRDLNILKLEECKAYLRKHGLRITGTKAICIQRILEHWRIKDGNGEKLYPRSSFIINCTGDVCMGDVVLFRQRVYERFDKVTRGGNPLGKRTIAGRIVKESYGARKQQHTFTVEILWSRGFKRLPPLYPLLVKGRNLYRLKTYRQRWTNEEKREKVLAEKHKRGAAARRAREIKKARSLKRGSKRPGHSCNSRPPTKRQSKGRPISERRGPDMYQMRGKAEKAKAVTGSSAAAGRQVQNNISSKYYGIEAPPPTRYYPYQMDANARFFPREGCHFGNYEASSSSMANPYVFDHSCADLMPARYNERTTVVPLIGVKSLGGMQRAAGGSSFPCATIGCRGLGAKGCVYSCCGNCCTRKDRKCKRHRL